ncbi:MAG TPA: hypothetical protein VGG98_08955 [Solirubrobacteraceae bacterium]|jgi:hypothetical protein
MIRSRFRSVLVAVVATLAIGALSASVVSSASAALPEWELTGGKNVPFTGTLPATGLREAGGAEYICAGGSISGQISGTKEVSKVFIKFVCGNSNSNAFCTKNGLKANEWETTELKGRLGYRSKSLRTVGLLLEPVSGHFADCSRSGVLLAILDSLIGEITPLSQTNKLHLQYNQRSGSQELQHFEGEEVIHNLEVEQVAFHSKQKLGVVATWTLETGKSEVRIHA